MKRLIPILAALALTGCVTYPPDLLVEQTQLLQKAADQNRAAASNIKAEYVDGAIATDDATRNAAHYKDIQEQTAKVAAGQMTPAEFDTWMRGQYAKLDADKAADDAGRMAPLQALETNATAIEGSIDRLKQAVTKINE